MKDLIEREPKVPHAINLLLFIIIISLGKTNYAQSSARDSVSPLEYEVVNSLFSDGVTDSVFIYNKTYYDKGWADYFNPQNFSRITSRVGIPTKISDSALRQILTDRILIKIKNNIYSSKPVAFKRKYLGNNIILENSFDEIKDLKKGIQRISQPIIIDNIAIFRKIGFSESPIFVLKKENDKWQIIYTFYDWLIIE